MTEIDFQATFKALTGYAPLKWQRRLYEEYFLKGDLPDICDLPTGLGKTSVIVIWLIALAAHLEAGKSSVLPRRLAYIVNRRTVVDQATSLVMQIRERIENVAQSDTNIVRLRSALVKACAYIGGHILAISTLRGELVDNEEWKFDPARPAIIIGTIDMIGSKLLFTGYGDGYRQRPYHAGLIGQDTLIVHDEAHLTPAFSDLLQAVKKEQNRCGDMKPLRVMELSATLLNSANRTVFSLSPEDDTDEVVCQRLRACKTLRIHEKKRNALTESIVELALAHKDQACKVLIFVNSPEEAQKAVSLLKKKLKEGSHARVDLLTGTIRGHERNLMVVERPVYRAFLSAESSPEQTIYLVSTSAGEVGIDLDADHMVCDLTTLDAMIQRLGRVNRRGGKDRTARVDVVVEELDEKDEKEKFTDSGSTTGADDAKKSKKSNRDTEKKLPPLKQAKRNAYCILKRLPSCKDENFDASPLALRELMDKQVDAKDALAPKPHTMPLTDILLDGWALTSLKERLPGQPEVAEYLHGLENDLPETYVAWRAEISHLAKIADAEEILEDWFRYCRVESAERLREVSGRVFDQLKALANRLKRDDLPVIILNERGEPNMRRLGAILNQGRQALYFQTLILPIEAGGLTPEGLLSGDEAHASDVAEASGTRRRLLLDVVDGQYSVRSLVENGSDIDALNELLSGSKTELKSPEEAVKKIADHYKWQVSQLLPLQEGSEIDEDAERSFLVLLVEPVRAAIEDPETAGRKEQPTIEDHCQLAERWAVRFADVLALDQLQREALAIAARWHDRGKDRKVWQRAIYNAGPVAYAKSGPHGMDGRKLGGYRHELGSLLEALHSPEITKHPEADLILHLIAAHHGWARPHFLPNAWDNERFTTAQNSKAAIEAMCRFGQLQQRFGRWGLAWLEALMHAVDVLASNQLLPENV